MLGNTLTQQVTLGKVISIYQSAVFQFIEVLYYTQLGNLSWPGK